MTPQTPTANTIDRHKLFCLSLRFAWAAIVLTFTLVLIAFSFIIGLITSRGNDNQGDDEDDYIARFGCADAADAEYNQYSHSDNYNIVSEDKTRF
jgi:hypothetical protein